MNNIFFISSINAIGGIETWLLNIGRKYGASHDILVVYSHADDSQLLRLQNYVRCERFSSGKRYKCKRAFFCYNALNYIGNVDAEEYSLVIHCDYKAMNLLPTTLPEITRYIGVSKTACESFKELTGIEPELCYNPLVADKPKKALKLVSATRLTSEKGRGRIDALAEILDKAGVAYTWDVFTDMPVRFNSPNVIRRPCRLDVLSFVATADYLVQLSDSEGLSYSMIEALSIGTPVIVTDFPSAHEIGVVDGVNGFILPMDLSTVPVEAICKGLKKFKYTAPKDGWANLLEPGEGNYLQEIEDTVLAKCLTPYFDLEMQRHVGAGEYFRGAQERIEYLTELGYAVPVSVR